MEGSESKRSIMEVKDVPSSLQDLPKRRGLEGIRRGSRTAHKRCSERGRVNGKWSVIWVTGLGD